MGLTTDGMSPADLAAVTGNNNGAFGEGNGAWWIIILFLFIFCGWGNGNGWNNGGGGAVDNYVLASDFATLQRQIDSGISSLERKGDAINSGICDGFYAMNTSLLNGFAGTNSTIQQNGYDTRNAIQQGQIADMQSFNALQAQLAQCCCDNKQAIAGVNYNMAMNTNAIQQEVTNGFCQTNFNNANNTRDIIDNQNNNARAILDALSRQGVSRIRPIKGRGAAMINMSEINAEIAALEAGKTTYATCERLSILYNVRNNLMSNQQPNQLSPNTSYYSYSSEPDSEFKEIARNADFEHLLCVLDEHMKAIEAMYPREYRSVLRKIKEGA